MLPPWSAVTWKTSWGPPFCGPRKDQPGRLGKEIGSGPASGGPASGGPASGGPASGGPASGTPPSTSGGPPSGPVPTFPEPVPPPHAQIATAPATAVAPAARNHFRPDLRPT